MPMRIALFGPSIVMPGLSSISPDWRIGGWMPSLNCSVMEISTWVCLRGGPSTLTRSTLPLGPIRFSFSLQAYWPGCESSCSFVSLCPGPKRACTCSCERWIWWAETSKGTGLGFWLWMILVTWRRFKARSVSRAIISSSLVGMIRTRTGASAVEMSHTSSKPRAFRFFRSSMWMPMLPRPWHARLRTPALPCPMPPVKTRTSSPPMAAT